MKLYIYIRDGGDGSACPLFFKTIEDRNKWLDSLEALDGDYYETVNPDNVWDIDTDSPTFFTPEWSDE